MMGSKLGNNKTSSRWFEVDVVPEAYTLPRECRPTSFDNNSDERVTFSVIDLSKVDSSSNDKEEIIQQIGKACQEVGVIQVINHGFSEELIEETTRVMKEFFSLSVEEKKYSGSGNGWVYLDSTDYANNGVYLWRENVKLPCHPLEKCMQQWPEIPSRYREVVAKYILAMSKLSSRMLELICEGLGLEADYLKDVGELQLLSSNNYPPCPNPSLTIGLTSHKDPSLITLLYQENTSGLQVLQNGDWISIPTLPNAFVVNIGNQLEIISNGRLKSPQHRVVTNAEKSRLSIATFVNPAPSYIVKPANALINESNPSLFDASTYDDYVNGTKMYGVPVFGVGSETLFKK